MSTARLIGVIGVMICFTHCGGDNRTGLQLCQEYSIALCARGIQCVGAENPDVAELSFCGADCANVVEAAYESNRAVLDACVESLPGSDCTPKSQQNPTQKPFTAVNPSDVCAYWQQLIDVAVPP